MVVIWSKEARNDLINYQVNSRIYKKGKLKSYINSLLAHVESLEQFPRLGKLFTYYKNIEVRQLFFSTHIILYCIEQDEIHILAVVHTSGDTKKHLDEIIRKM